MLVLSRKRGEKIVIGGKIEIVVVEASGHRVRLGINAPSEVTVHRSEVLERIRQESAEEVPAPSSAGAMRFDQYSFTEGI